jgi:hypothetical protein
MNTNSTLFLALDHAAELLVEADHERLAREARVTAGTASTKSARRSTRIWSLFSLRRSPARSPR